MRGNKGVYVLIIELDDNSEIEVGKLGTIEFESGFYAYVGSALNFLDKRIERHLRRNKRLRWHIDYFLRKSKIKLVIYAETKQRYECKIARRLAVKFKSIDKFGSTDCSCRSHLFYSPDCGKLEEYVISTMRNNDLLPIKRNIQNK
ncbi:MAG: GIY-YIG nuclease family protein, partial [Candidatus Altiarchaeales archaeon]